ncbi:hypothetical protein [Parasphingorhabdus pacifica]
MTQRKQQPREHSSDPAEGIRQPEGAETTTTHDTRPRGPTTEADRRPHADDAAEGE